MISRKPLAVSILFCLSLFNAASGQTLFTYGNKSVTKSEFLKAYSKNNTTDKSSETNYRDYLDLYTKFKIKVQAAMDMKLDTLASLNAELQNFRSQISQNFLTDEGSMDELIDEAYLRSQRDIRVAHIFIPVKPEDSLNGIKVAENKINQAYEALKTQSFEKVAQEYSEDPLVKANKGDLGYITAFVLPYNLETAIYHTASGRYTRPLQSSAGFHILKNVGERKAAGRIKVAQILVTFPPGASTPQQELARKKADSLAKLLENGADFKQLALQHSNDNLTYQNGGELPEFGVGRYDPIFESAAFSLRNDGEISKPLRTEFGYHILKRLALTGAPRDKTDQQWLESTRLFIKQSDRMEVSRKKMLTTLQRKTGFKRLAINQTSLWRLTDSMLANKPVPELKDINGNTVLFTFTKQTVKVRDWQNYVESIRNIAALVTGKTKRELFDQFVETSTFEYYREHLEEFNEEFRMQMNEFKEGNLLFEVMQRKIWDIAANDSLALRNFYDKNSSKYWWEASADAIIFTCADDKIAENLQATIKTNVRNWKTIVDTSNGMIQADSGRFELGQIPVVERTNFTDGLITAPVKNETDKTVAFAYILKLYKDREARTFQDAKGFVINDYQEFLEEKWVAELKKKYPLKINEVVFSSLPK